MRKMGNKELEAHQREYTSSLNRAGGNRTLTELLPQHFKCCASTISPPPRSCAMILTCYQRFVNQENRLIDSISTCIFLLSQVHFHQRLLARLTYKQRFSRPHLTLCERFTNLSRRKHNDSHYNRHIRHIRHDRDIHTKRPTLPPPLNHQNRRCTGHEQGLLSALAPER